MADDNPLHDEIEEARKLSAQRRRDAEEEELNRQRRRQRRKVRVIHNDTEAVAFQGGMKWREPTDFKVPSPFLQRRLPASGPRTFHLAWDPVSRTIAWPKDRLNSRPPMPGQGGTGFSTPLDHARYIERRSGPGIAHDVYIERRNRSQTAGEEAVSELRDDAPGDLPAVWSNISADPAVRDSYWRAIERSENEPGVLIRFRPSFPDRQLETLAENPQIPRKLRQYAMKVLKLRQTEARTGLPQKIRPLSVKPANALGIYESLVSTSSPEAANDALTFEHGRGGRIQFRFVGELPAELSDGEREELVAGWCREMDGVGLMYTAVIHPPDENNDKRNYHVHMVAHDRHGDHDPETGLWSFERVAYHREGRNEVRQKRIGKSKKETLITQSFSVTCSQISGVNFRPWLRQKYADHLNGFMRAKEIDRTYHPGTYADIGIDLTPTKHLGRARVLLEEIGVVTEVGEVNAAALWSDAERQIEKDVEIERGRLQAQIRRLKDALATSPSGTEAEQFVDRFENAVAIKCKYLRAINLFNHFEERARSRAVVVVKACDNIIEKSAGSKAPASIRVVALATARKAEAERHLQMIERQLAGCRRAVLEAKKALVKAEAQLRSLAGELDSWNKRLSAPERAAVREPSRSQEPAPTPRLNISAVLSRVIKDDLEIREVDGRFTVDGLNPAEAELFAKLQALPPVAKSITEIRDKQAKEVGRLEESLKRKLSDPQKLVHTKAGWQLIGRLAEVTLFDRYQHFAVIKQRLETEGHRRAAAPPSKAAPKTPPKQTRTPSPYPAVVAFELALLTKATEQRLEKLAAKIDADPVQRTAVLARDAVVVAAFQKHAPRIDPATQQRFLDGQKGVSL